MHTSNLTSLFREPRHLLAAGVGIAFAWLSSRFWGWYAVDNPITNWLLDEFARNGQENVFYGLTRVHDFFINFALAIPVAVILHMFAGPRKWKPVWISVIAFHVVLFWGAEFSNFDLLFKLWGFWIGLFTTVTAIPLAYWLIGESKLFRPSS